MDRDLFTENIFLSDTSTIPSIENGVNNFNTQSQTYVVQSGDTLYQIAQMFGTTVKELAQINNIQNPNLIFPGQVLRILTNSTVNGGETRGAGSIYKIQI